MICLHLLCLEGNVIGVKNLLNCKIDFEYEYEHRIILQSAVLSGNHQVVNLLLHAGANVNTIGTTGTALHEAAGLGDV